MRSRHRRFANAVLAVLVAVSGAGCGDTSLADLLHDSRGSAVLDEPSKLNDPEIATARRGLPGAGRTAVDLCRLLTEPEVAAAMGREPLAPPEGGGLRCTWKFPTSSPRKQDRLEVSVAGLDGEGVRTELRGNSALERRFPDASCEQIVALNHPDPTAEPRMTPELAVRITALGTERRRHAHVCPQARELLGRAFDRLPPTTAPWGTQ